MSPTVSITLRTFTIWIMASVIHGTLSGIYITIIEEQQSMLVSNILICGVCSLVFSVPGFFVFWIAMLIAVNGGVYERALFRAALSAGFILAIITGIASIGLFRSVYSGDWFLFPVLITFSAIASIMMHFNLFKKITGNDHL